MRKLGETKPVAIGSPPGLGMGAGGMSGRSAAARQGREQARQLALIRLKRPSEFQIVPALSDCILLPPEGLRSSKK